MYVEQSVCIISLETVLQNVGHVNQVLYRFYFIYKFFLYFAMIKTNVQCIYTGPNSTFRLLYCTITDGPSVPEPVLNNNYITNIITSNDYKCHLPKLIHMSSQGIPNVDCQIIINVKFQIIINVKCQNMTNVICQNITKVNFHLSAVKLLHMSTGNCHI